MSESTGVLSGEVEPYWVMGGVIDVKLDESAVKDRPLEGYIGLQDHGEPHNLRFRNIWLKEL